MQKPPAAWPSPRRTNKLFRKRGQKKKKAPSPHWTPVPLSTGHLRSHQGWEGVQLKPHSGLLHFPPSPPSSAPDSPAHAFGGLSLVEVKSSLKAEAWDLPLNLFKALWLSFSVT